MIFLNPDWHLLLQYYKNDWAVSTKAFPDSMAHSDYESHIQTDPAICSLLSLPLSGYFNKDRLQSINFKER